MLRTASSFAIQVACVLRTASLPFANFAKGYLPWQVGVSAPLSFIDQALLLRFLHPQRAASVASSAFNKNFVFCC